MFVTVKLKQIVLWKTRRFMPLMRIDKLLHANCSSNVNADSLSSTQMETLLLALREWIVKVSAWVHCSESHQILGTVSFLQKKTGYKPYCFGNSLLFFVFFFPQGKQRLSVSSIVSGIMTQLATWTQRQHSPSAWLWRDRHLSPSVSTKLLCLFKHFLN